MKKYRLNPIFFAFAIFAFFTIGKPSALKAQVLIKEIPQAVRTAFTTAGVPVLKRPSPIINFTVPLLDGKNVSLKGFKGKVVFLNFWATWCPPCRQEMPSMETLYQHFKDQGLEFLAVDIQESKDDVADFMKSYGLNFPTALDSSGGISNKYGIRSIPTTYIVDREGFIIISAVGGRNWDTPEMFAAFEVLLKNGK
jgi:thiol-disulfide isomerase/thioredoxin